MRKEISIKQLEKQFPELAELINKCTDSNIKIVFEAFKAGMDYAKRVIKESK